MTEGKTTDCVMEGIRLWKEVYTGKAINVAMIEDDVFAVCKERDALLRRVAELEAKLAGTPLDIVDRHITEERERIIAVLLNTESPNDFLDLIDNDLCGIPCWHEEKLRAVLQPK